MLVSQQLAPSLSGVNNNGLHSANGITALFIATGQDVANVSESSAGIIYTELTPERDLYFDYDSFADCGNARRWWASLPKTNVSSCSAVWGGEQFISLRKLWLGLCWQANSSPAAAISSSDGCQATKAAGRNR